MTLDTQELHWGEMLVKDEGRREQKWVERSFRPQCRSEAYTMRVEKEGLGKKTLHHKAVLRRSQLYQKVSEQRLLSRGFQHWADSALVPTLHLGIGWEQPKGTVASVGTDRFEEQQLKQKICSPIIYTFLHAHFHHPLHSALLSTSACRNNSSFSILLGIRHHFL